MRDAPVIFSGHRGITPMLWAFAALVTIELLVVHLFLSLVWPTVAWVLTIATAISLAWLLRFITSFKRCPHLLKSDRLRLRMGSLRTIDIPLANIVGVRSHWPSGAEQSATSANLVPLAFPNRLIDFSPSVAGRRGPLSAVAIRIDDPESFDAALAARGVKLG
jgi:membrane-bound metal-dependent hydrolase YbcI (DUF457 family)